jgi:NADH-quinone oxidoreductase subunit K
VLWPASLPAGLFGLRRQRVSRLQIWNFGGEVVPTSYYLVLSAVLFGLGVIAFIFKRNILTIFMSIELMLNAVNLAFVTFSRALGQLQGQVFVFFVIVVAAAEAAVGLAIVILIHRNRGTLNVERVDSLKD